MAGNHHGGGSSSIELDIGLRQACVASLEEKRRRFLSENIDRRAKQPSIWRVHSRLRNQDPEAYDPQLVSIGPFHHGKKELSPMEELKLENLCFILATYLGKTLEDYVNEVFALLPQARDEYSENIELSDDKFAEMLVIDGCFLVGVLAMMDPIMKSPFFSQVSGSCALVWRDLMLIENQIPLFVVIKLSNMISKEIFGSNRVLDVVAAVLEHTATNIPQDKYPREEACRHLLHLKYLSLNPDLISDESPQQSYWQRGIFLANMLVGWIMAPLVGLFYLILFGDCPNPFGSSNKSRKSSYTVAIPSASELYEYGVKFQKMTIPEQKTFHVIPKASFKNGTLVLPWLRIEDSTCSELRNLIAFEQCFKGVDPRITIYCFLLDYLINTADDVAILRRSGVLDNMLGSDSELAEMFNSLCKEVYADFPKNHFGNVYEDLIDFCEIPHHRWRANLSQKYFSNPWTFFSVMAAATLIVCTITQTLFAVYPRE